MEKDKTSNSPENVACDMTGGESAQKQLKANKRGKKTTEEQSVETNSASCGAQGVQQELKQAKDKKFYPTWTPINQSSKISGGRTLDANSGLERNVDDCSYSTAPSFNSGRDVSNNEKSIPQWRIPKQNKQVNPGTSDKQIRQDTDEQDQSAPLSNFPVQVKGRTSIDEIFTKKQRFKRPTSFPSRAHLQQTGRGQSDGANECTPSSDSFLLNASFPGAFQRKKLSTHGNIFNTMLDAMWKVPKEQKMTRSAEDQAIELSEIKSTKPRIESLAEQMAYSQTSFSTLDPKRVIRPTSMEGNKKTYAKKIPLSSTRASSNAQKQEERMSAAHSQSGIRQDEHERHESREYEEDGNRSLEQHYSSEEERALLRYRDNDEIGEIHRDRQYDRGEVWNETTGSLDYDDERSASRGRKACRWSDINEGKHRRSSRERGYKRTDGRQKSSCSPDSNEYDLGGADARISDMNEQARPMRSSDEQDGSIHLREQGKMERRRAPEEARKALREPMSPRRRTKREIKRNSSPVRTTSPHENLQETLRKGLNRKPEDDGPMSYNRRWIDYNSRDAEDIRAAKREAARDFMKGKTNRKPSPQSSDEEDLPPFPTDVKYENETLKGWAQSRKGDDFPFEENYDDTIYCTLPPLNVATQQTNRRKHTGTPSKKTRRGKFIESLELSSQALDPIAEEQLRTSPKPSSRKSQDNRRFDAPTQKTQPFLEYLLGLETPESSDSLYDPTNELLSSDLQTDVDVVGDSICPHCEFSENNCTCKKPKLRFKDDIIQADVHAEAENPQSFTDLTPSTLDTSNDREDQPMQRLIPTAVIHRKQPQSEHVQLNGDERSKRRKKERTSRKGKKSTAKQTRPKFLAIDRRSNPAVKRHGGTTATRPKAALKVDETTTTESSIQSPRWYNVTLPTLTPTTPTPAGSPIFKGSMPSINTQARCWRRTCCCLCYSEPCQQMRRDYCDGTYYLCVIAAIFTTAGAVVSLVMVILLTDMYLLIPMSVLIVLALIFVFIACLLYRKGYSCLPK